MIGSQNIPVKIDVNRENNHVQFLKKYKLNCWTNVAVSLRFTCYNSYDVNKKWYCRHVEEKPLIERELPL